MFPEPIPPEHPERAEELRILLRRLIHLIAQEVVKQLKKNENPMVVESPVEAEPKEGICSETEE